MLVVEIGEMLEGLNENLLREIVDLAAIPYQFINDLGDRISIPSGERLEGFLIARNRSPDKYRVLFGSSVAFLFLHPFLFVHGRRRPLLVAESSE